MKQKTSIFTGIVAMSLTLATSASATLVSYDGFESYAEAGLDGNNGGTGWDSNWSAIAGANVVSGGLSYNNGSIAIDGGSQSLKLSADSHTAILRTFDTASLGNEIYFSYLFRAGSSSANNFFNLYLTDASSTGSSAPQNSPGQIGDLSTSARQFGARLNGSSSTQQLDGSYTDNTTYLLVGRISDQGTSGPGVGGGNFNLVELWVNPTSTIAGVPDASVDSNAADAPVGSIVRLGMRTFSAYDSSEIHFDEMRIGTVFQSVVVPEPSTSALIVGSVILGGLLLLRRRQ